MLESTNRDTCTSKMSDDEPEIRSFKDAKNQEGDRMKILKRYIKKKKPSGQSRKLNKNAEEDEAEPTTGPGKARVEPGLYQRVSESLPQEALRDFVKTIKATKIAAESSFEGKKIILEKPKTVAKKLVGDVEVVYVKEKKFIPPAISKEADAFQSSQLFRNAHRRAPLQTILRNKK